MKIDGGQKVWNKETFPNYEALLLHLAASEPISFDEVETAWTQVNAPQDRYETLPKAARVIDPVNAPQDRSARQIIS